jgi:large subunit ribosomal protein L9
VALKKNIELLLTETVENLGIVGDVVQVKPGHARNFLLPLGIAEVPTPEKIEALKECRASAQADLEALRERRVDTVDKLENIVLKLTRSCNDQGVLYGSVTQRDIADALLEGELEVEERAIRLNQPIRRIGGYSVLIQFEKELRVEIGIEILPDRTLEELEEEEMEFDNEGELIEKPRRPRSKKAADKESKEEAGAGDEPPAKDAPEGDASGEEPKTDAEDS